MRADEIRELSDDEIRARVAELEEERFRLRFRSATETLEDPLRVRGIRKDVARLKTVLRERELAGAAASGGAARGTPAPAAKSGTTRKRGTAGTSGAARKAGTSRTRR